jgi:hypothetical protein
MVGCKQRGDDLLEPCNAHEHDECPTADVSRQSDALAFPPDGGADDE